ncbi:LysR family transcriptional regulator [Vreelandella populi]|uniref:LysR family transcriptional regulator n=1 Tax=Vreelandella populi TaxID=2498858 RepID=A0A433LEP7_9GAMM|nr:LysR family transcriptional regulator [Halomonas populi]RUR35391.1 LysR family transcriptional regulator [Halomonas populi]RUR47581.1 LysR family transcriptional regulator [Halomonas populi]
MALTFRQLSYFLVLSEELHFGRAAQRLHISQPPLSASLRQLEGELGVKLLERSSKRVELTPAGEAFQHQARRILGQLKDSQELVQRIAASASGLVRVGFTPAMLFRGLPEVITNMKTHYPGIDIQLTERNSAQQVDAVVEEKLDIGFIHSMPLPEGIESLVLSDESFLCCLPAHHPLAAQRTIAIKALANEPIIIFGRELAPHYYDRIISLFHHEDVDPYICHEVSHWLTILALVANAMGVALVPQSLAKAGFINVRFLPLEDVTTSHQSHCIWRGDMLYESRDLLLKCLKEHLSS